MSGSPRDDGSIRVLEESRRREKRQTLFYRALAAEAELSGEPVEAERLNELHADEQHHLSRLTARVLEMGGMPVGLRDLRAPEANLEGWEEVARGREDEEIRWYEEVLEEELDEQTRSVVDEILRSERHHRKELRGKWMSA